ncbi:MAG TPA: hypothetical protein VGH87_15175, partial [Polyangiaceae bacterium]
MRRIFLVVGCVSACGLFPSLDDLGTDAAITSDASDVAAQETGGDAGDAAVCGFPIGPTNGLVAYYAFDDG